MADGGAMNIRMMATAEVCEVTGLSRWTLDRLEARGEFPARRRLARNRIGWRSDEIESWLLTRPASAATRVICESYATEDDGLDERETVIIRIAGFGADAVAEIEVSREGGGTEVLEIPPGLLRAFQRHCGSNEATDMAWEHGIRLNSFDPDPAQAIPKPLPRSLGAATDDEVTFSIDLVEHDGEVKLALALMRDGEQAGILHIAPHHLRTWRANLKFVTNAITDVGVPVVSTAAI